ncbi:MAG: imidazole glycerol phosphate synthase subunit HisF [Bacteroidetes bacterium]|nr:imidazole glycerol phosphate synthase subunit HisF [Bacteroidota bacterium]
MRHSRTRIIARIDVKNEFVIKGIHLEGLRKVGNPVELARKYYQQGVDEILFMDAVASLYGRNNLFHIIEQACREVFIPITIGGGLRSVEDIDLALKSGADKISINTQAIKEPTLITRAAEMYGSQAVVASIEAKNKGSWWEAYTDNGREETGLNVVEWAKEVERLGAGEILLTSVDMEGTKKGFDLELAEQVYNAVSVPVIFSGGAGQPDHVLALADRINPDAVAFASILHYNTFGIQELKQNLNAAGMDIRM